MYQSLIVMALAVLLGTPTVAASDEDGAAQEKPPVYDMFRARMRSAIFHYKVVTEEEVLEYKPGCRATEQLEDGRTRYTMERRFGRLSSAGVFEMYKVEEPCEPFTVFLITIEDETSARRLLRFRERPPMYQITGHPFYGDHTAIYIEDARSVRVVPRPLN